MAKKQIPKALSGWLALKENKGSRISKHMQKLAYKSHEKRRLNNDQIKKVDKPVDFE